MARAKPIGSGRQKGTPNKATAEIKALARAHGPHVVETLADIMANSGSDTARIAAARELLDRGYGKATALQEHAGPDGTALTPPQLIIQRVGKEEP